MKLTAITAFEFRAIIRPETGGLCPVLAASHGEKARPVGCFHRANGDDSHRSF